jgi:roadblock/LC7 domain-containing protein
MSVKLNHYWTVNHSKKDAYDKFIIKKFIPKINQLGMHTVAGWSVLVGAYSEIIFESAANDLDLLEKSLRDERYKVLKSDLLNYVKNYKTKVLVATGKKDTYSVDVREDTVKFNQMWNIVSGQKEAFDKYTEEEFYPVLEELGISVAREWEVLIGEGPGILCEGRVADINSLIRNLQSKKFNNAKLKLRQYVEGYESRILTFHIQKIKGYKSASYNIISD